MVRCQMRTWYLVAASCAAPRHGLKLSWDAISSDFVIHQPADVRQHECHG